MAEKEPNPSPNSPIPVDEIDFGPFFRILQRIFSNIGYGILFGIKAAFKGWLILGIWLFLGAAGSVGAYFLMDKIYESDAMMTSGELGNQYCFEKVTNLRRMVNNKSYNLLAEELNISLSTAANINDIVYLNYHRNINPHDSIDQAEFFRIAIAVYDVSVLDSLNETFQNYLENNEYALTRKALSKNRMERMVAQISNDIVELDSLKLVVAASLMPMSKGQGGFIFGEPADPISVYDKQISLLESKIEYEDQLRVMDNIQIVTRFTPFEKPVQPNALFLLRFGLIFGFLIGYVMAISKAIRKRSANVVAA